MITTADLIRLPYSPDLTQAGIAYACRRLACATLAEDQKTYISLRDQVTFGAASLAFLRYLSNEQVPHTVHGAIPYTDPGSYTIQLGSRRCLLKTNLIINRETIHYLRRHPEEILGNQVQMEVSDLESDVYSSDDLLVFALVLGLVTRKSTELESALEAQQPLCLIHTLPALWSNPIPGSPLNEIALKSKHSQAIEIEAGGRDLKGLFHEETCMLQPRVRSTLKESYQSLSYLRSNQPVSSQVGLSCQGISGAQVVQPGQWGNIWVYGLEIFLVGYQTRAEFRQRGLLENSDESKPPGICGKKKNLPYGQLHPLAGLFEWARKF